MKYLIFIALFVLGGIIGYLVGINQTTEMVIDGSAEKQLVTEFVYDTIVHHERVEVPVYKTPKDTLNELPDTLEQFEKVLDTLKERILPKDTTSSSEDFNINRDELITSQLIPIIYLDKQVDKDSLIKNLLGIKQNRPTEMVVQFWKSPLNYSGYKLSRNTLILYGLSEQFEYKIYQRDNFHYLSNETVFYRLSETQEFLPYLEVDKTEVLND